MTLVLAFAGRSSEDVFICYRFAKNLVCGGGLTYTPGERIEGISNPAWTLAMAGLYQAGVALPWAGWFLLVTCSALLFWAVRGTGRRLFGADSWYARVPLAGLICATNLSASFGNLLEGSGVALFAVLLFRGMLEKSWLRMTVAAVALMTLRPETPFIAVAAGCWLLFEAWRKRVAWNSVWRYMACTGCSLLAIVLIRFFYYGDIIPNSVHAKGAASLEEGLATFADSYSFIVGYIVYLNVGIGVFTLLGLLRRETRSLMAGTFAIIVFQWLLTGMRNDWMQSYRLFIPYFPVHLFIAVSGAAYFQSARPAFRWLLGIALAGSLILLIRLSPISEAMELVNIGTFFPKPVAAPAETFQENALSPHLTNFDLAWPDDLFVVEQGGRSGWLLDAVPCVEYDGLTDRSFSTAWPLLQQRDLGGVNNWKRAFERNPSGLLLYVDTFEYYMPRFILMPDLRDALSRYVMVRKNEKASLEFILRSDREAATLFLRDFGDFSPVLDFLWTQGDALDARFPWQHVPWREGSAVHFPEWRSWGDIERVSVAAFLPEGKTSYHKPLPGNAPVILMFGLAPREPLEGRISVYAESSSGQRLLAVFPLSGNEENRFITVADILTERDLDGAEALTLEMDTAVPGVLYTAAYRWNSGPLPALPSDFVRDRLRHAVRYQAKHGTARGAAFAAAGLARFETLDDSQVESRLAGKTKAFKEACLARYAAWNHPDSHAALEALDACHRASGNGEARILEWKTLAERRVDRAEPWLYLATAYFDEGDLEGFFAAAQRVIAATPRAHPLRLRLAEILRGDLMDPPWVQATGFPPLPDNFEAFRAMVVRDDDVMGVGLARYLERSGRLDDAVALCREIAALNPGLRETFDTWTRLLRLQGDSSYTARELTSYLIRHPETLWGWQFLARTFADMEPGEAVRATDQFEKEYVEKRDAISFGGGRAFDFGTCGFKRLFRDEEAFKALAEAKEHTEQCPGQYLAWFGLGLTYEYLQKYPEAIRAYAEALERRPGSNLVRDAWNRARGSYAQQLFDWGAYDDANVLLGELRAEDAPAPIAWRTGVLLAEQRGDLSLARTLYQKIPALYPDARISRKEFQDMASVLEGGDDSRGVLTQFLEAFPDDAGAWRRMGLACERDGDLTAGAAAATRAYRLDPNQRENRDAWERIAVAYAEDARLRGDTATALRVCEDLRAVAAAPCAAWEIPAQIYAGKNDTEASRRLYRALIFQHPGYAPALEALSNSYAAGTSGGEDTPGLVAWRTGILLAQQRGDLPLARTLFTKMPAMLPDDRISREELREMASALAGGDDTRAIWRQFLAVFPDDAEGWRQMGVACEQEGDLSASAAAAARAHRLAPERDAPREDWERIEAAYAAQLLARDHVEEALRIYAELRQGNAHQTTAWEIPARIYAEKNNPEESRRLYRELVSRQPHHYPAFEALSNIYVQANDIEGLLAEWRDYTTKHPEAPLGWYCLGIAQERRHDYAEAAAAYRKGLALDPSAQGTREALERVLPTI